MALQVITKPEQASGQFNNGQIIENKPIGFPQDGGNIRPYSNLFYWAYAEAKEDSTIGLHPHQGFEIMSFVLNGSIRHFDTKLKEWRPLYAGDAQIIRAGNGISHAEHMEKDAVMFQIWVDPNLDKTLNQEASYNDYKSEDFPVFERDGFTIKSYSGQTDSPLTMDAPGIIIEEWRFVPGKYSTKIDAGKVASVYVMEGALTLNGSAAQQDDFVIAQSEDLLEIEVSTESRLFVITSLAEINYKTYAEVMQERMRR